MCARGLNNWGANVTVWLSSIAERLTEVPRHQLSILERRGRSDQLTVGGMTYRRPTSALTR